MRDYESLSKEYIGVLYLRKSEIEKIFEELNIEDALVLEQEYIKIEELLEFVSNNVGNINYEDFYYTVLEYFRTYHETRTNYVLDSNERIK